MQYMPGILEAGSAEHEVDSCLNALIIYEDVVTGKRAKETCDVVRGQLGPSWNIEIEMSSFKSLRHPRARNLATATARSASLVIFSCYDRLLPVEVFNWTEWCLVPSEQPKSLVALVAVTDRQTRPSCGAEKYLSAVAQRSGMKFFSHFYTPLNGT